MDFIPSPALGMAEKYDSTSKGAVLGEDGWRSWDYKSAFLFQVLLVY